MQMTCQRAGNPECSPHSPHPQDKRGLLGPRSTTGPRGSARPSTGEKGHVWTLDQHRLEPLSSEGWLSVLCHGMMGHGWGHLSHLAHFCSPTYPPTTGQQSRSESGVKQARSEQFLPWISLRWRLSPCYLPFLAPETLTPRGIKGQGQGVSDQGSQRNGYISAACWESGRGQEPKLDI